MKRPYFLNPWIDALCMGGLSLVLFLWAVANRESPFSVSTWALQWAWGLSWVINYPHFIATIQRLYEPNQREKHRFAAYGLPPIFLALFFAGCGWPELVGGYLIKIFLVWSAFHFCAQSLGFTFIYAARLGVSISGNERLLLKAFTYSAFLHQWVSLEATGPFALSQSILVPLFHMPRYFTQITFGISLACLGFLLLASAQKRALWKKENWILPFPLISLGTWFVWGATVNSLQALVPMFHSLQYLLFAGSLVEKSRRLVWASTSIAGGFVLFWVLPALGDQLTQSRGIIAPLVLATVQIHHFVVDGILWKMKDSGLQEELLPQDLHHTEESRLAA